MKDIPREFFYLSSVDKERPPIFGVYWPFAVASQVASRVVPLFSWWSTSPTQTTLTLHTYNLQHRTNKAIPSAAYWSRLFGYQTGLTWVQDLHSFSCKMLSTASSEVSVLLSTWESTERIPLSQLQAESFTKCSNGLSCEWLELDGRFSSTSETKCR